MTRSTVLMLSAAALLGCSNKSNNAIPSNPSTGPSAGGPGATGTQPQITGVFKLEAAKTLRYPVRVASAGGTVYVTDAQANQVVGLAGGITSVAITGLDKPLGLAVAGDLVYVGNAGRKDVEVYSLSQQAYLRSLGGAGAFEMPNAIAVASDGTVFVVDSKKNVVQVYSAAGAYVKTLGGQGSQNGQFLFPVAVAVDDTRIVVGDQGNHRVQIFDRAGTFVSSFGSEVTSGLSRDNYKGKFTSIAGVALAGDSIYVLDSAHAYVQVLGGAGTFKGFLGSSGSCATCMKLGLDVTVAADGSVLLTDPENSRVVTLSPELR